MDSDTLINSGTPTRFNNVYDSEVDNLSGTTVLGRYTLLERINEPSGEAVLYLAGISADSADSESTDPASGDETNNKNQDNYSGSVQDKKV